MPEQIDLDKRSKNYANCCTNTVILAIELGNRHHSSSLKLCIKSRTQIASRSFKYMLKKNKISMPANNQNFLLRHAAALQHRLNHHFLIARQFEVALTDEQTFEAEMQELKKSTKNYGASMKLCANNKK